jgi:hypothetical protein
MPAFAQTCSAGYGKADIIHRKQTSILRSVLLKGPMKTF